MAVSRRGRRLDLTVGPDPDQAEPGRDLLWPGEFLFGYPSQVGQFPPNEDPDMTKPGAPQEPDTDFTRNGAFLGFGGWSRRCRSSRCR